MYLLGSPVGILFTDIYSDYYQNINIFIFATWFVLIFFFHSFQPISLYYILSLYRLMLLDCYYLFLFFITLRAYAIYIFFFIMERSAQTGTILKKSKICCLSEFRVSSNSEILLHYFLTLKYQKQFHYLHSWVHLQNKEFLNSRPWKFFWHCVSQ